MPDFTPQDPAWARTHIASLKVNQARLMGCPIHDFVQLATAQLRPQYRCQMCEGVVGDVEREWYERGMRDIIRAS